MSARLRALIVDDERLARVELKRLLAAHPEVEVVGEADDAQQALHLLQALTPDIAFLDIQMPGMSGLQLAEEIEDRCQLVFCTAYDSFAIDAFGLNALDYLVKPVAPERLAKTLARVRPAQQAGAPVYLPHDHGLLLKFGDNARIVRLHDINRFESIGNHAAVYSAHGKSFLLSSLNRIEQRLDPAHFFRVSRSDILRLDAIARFEIDIGLIAHLHDGSAVAVSRRQAQVLKTRMGGL